MSIFKKNPVGTYAEAYLGTRTFLGRQILSSPLETCKLSRKDYPTDVYPNNDYQKKKKKSNRYNPIVVSNKSILCIRLYNKLCSHTYDSWMFSGEMEWWKRAWKPLYSHTFLICIIHVRFVHSTARQWLNYYNESINYNHQTRAA